MLGREIATSSISVGQPSITEKLRQQRRVYSQRGKLVRKSAATDLPGEAPPALESRLGIDHDRRHSTSRLT
jgi:hypothetical protein